MNLGRTEVACAVYRKQIMIVLEHEVSEDIAALKFMKTSANASFKWLISIPSRIFRIDVSLGTAARPKSRLIKVPRNALEALAAKDLSAGTWRTQP